MSQVKITTEKGFTQVFVDGVEQRDLCGIGVEFGLHGTNTLTLKRYAPRVEIEVDADVVNLFECPYCRKRTRD